MENEKHEKNQTNERAAHLVAAATARRLANIDRISRF
jgi:hypothetical protein